MLQQERFRHNLMLPMVFGAKEAIPRGSEAQVKKTRWISYEWFGPLFEMVLF